MQQPSPEARREKLVNQLRDNLVGSGLSDGALLACGLLEAHIRRALSAHGSAAAKMPATTLLRSVLTAVVEHERQGSKELLDLRAAAEFIGHPDPAMPDPSFKDSEKMTDAPNTRQMSLLRGGQFLRYRGEPIVYVRNIRNHVDRCLGVLLEAIDVFLTDANLVRALFVELDDGQQNQPSERLGVQLSAATGAAHIQPMHASRYIRRPALERQFADLVNSGTKLIALVGQAGMGKTWLARGVTAQRLGEPATPVIEFSSAVPNEPDLRAALVHFKLGVGDLNAGNILHKLVDLLCSERAPKFVVLDNLQSSSELRAIVPYDTRAVVVATCREKGRQTPAHCEYIEVSPMTADEARQLVQANLPGVELDDAADSALRLANYPLAIGHACGLAAATRLPLSELCAALAKQPGNIATESGETLDAILTLTLGALRQRDEAAIWVVAMLCFGPLKLDRSGRLVRHLHSLLDTDPASAALAFAQTVQNLRSFGLVEERDYSGSAHIALHTFTSSILAGLLKLDYSVHWRRMEAIEMVENHLGAYRSVAQLKGREALREALKENPRLLDLMSGTNQVQLDKDS